MTLVFVYGTLKQGFPNQAINRGRRVGRAVTHQLWPLYLVGERRSPWLLDRPGEGLHVTGELYEVDEETLAGMDRLERIAEPDGYRRRTIAVTIPGEGAHRGAQVYLKDPALISPGDIKAGPLAEYTPEHAKLYRKRQPA